MTIPVWAIGIIVTLGAGLFGSLMTFVIRFTRTNVLLDALEKTIGLLSERIDRLERSLGRLDRTVGILDDRQHREPTNPVIRLAIADSGPIKE